MSFLLLCGYNIPKYRKHLYKIVKVYSNYLYNYVFKIIHLEKKELTNFLCFSDFHQNFPSMVFKTPYGKFTENN